MKPDIASTKLPTLLQTIPEAAARLNVGRSTIYELIRTHQLEVIKIGRCARVPSDALEQLVLRLRGQAP